MKAVRRKTNALIQNGVEFETVFSSACSRPRILYRMLCAGFSAVAALGAAMFVSTTPALADFRVCNGTQNLVGVSIGYRSDEGWITEGWWQVPATSCATLIEGQLSARYYYLYAEDAARGGRWAGDINMCVAENEFKIVGVNDCIARGFQRMEFKEYDTGQQGSWMVQLSDAPAGQESSSQ
jgi:uncharacterized membrane protein